MKTFSFQKNEISFRKHSILFGIENLHFSNTKVILLSIRKHFHFGNVFRIKIFSIKKKIIFVSETLSRLFSKHLAKKLKKIVTVLWLWPMRATIRWGLVFPLEKAFNFSNNWVTGQHIQVLTNCTTTTTPQSHNPSASLSQKIPFTYCKPQVARLMSQIPQIHFPNDRLSQQGKSQTSLHVRAIRSRATGARHRHRRICKSSLLKWKHWPSMEDCTHGAQPQNCCDFFQFFCEIIQKQKWKCFWNESIFFKTKIFSFKKHLRN